MGWTWQGPVLSCHLCHSPLRRLSYPRDGGWDPPIPPPDWRENLHSDSATWRLPRKGITVWRKQTFCLVWFCLNTQVRSGSLGHRPGSSPRRRGYILFEWNQENLLVSFSIISASLLFEIQVLEMINFVFTRVFFFIIVNNSESGNIKSIHTLVSICLLNRFSDRKEVWVLQNRLQGSVWGPLSTSSH